jgi:hypothetical protein
MPNLDCRIPWLSAAIRPLSGEEGRSEVLGRSRVLKVSAMGSGLR